MSGRLLRPLLVALAVLAAGGGFYAYWYFRPSAATVPARAETQPVPNDEDAADDPAIFVHPLDAARSLILGTDKEGGLSVYDLTGRELQRFDNGPQNNVDVRTIEVAGRSESLAAASTNDYSKIFLYRIEPATDRVERLITSTVRTGIETEGLCLYRSARTDKLYVFVTGDDLATNEDGIVEQYELVWDPSGDRYLGDLVRRFDVGGEVEGCVADDDHGSFFVSEETTAVWRYGAEPDSGEAREVVERCGSGGRVRYNAEGLAIYPKPDGGGYFVVSSQGSNDFLVYDRRPPHVYRGAFQVGASGTVDAVSHTDGIDVVAAALPGYPRGLFVAQDDENGGENQNFKLASWQDVELALELR